MSDYTTEVRYICEKAAGLNESTGYSQISEILDKVALKVFDFDFPIFDEKYRKPLIIKILRHYYTREICEETVGLWKLRVEDRLNRIMPFYNQLYNSQLLKIDPLTDTNLTRTHTLSRNEESTDNINSENTSTTTLNNKNNSKNLYSDTPQGSIQNLENQTYLTNATVTNDETQQNSTNKLTGKDSSEHKLTSIDDYIESLTGKSSGVSYSKLLLEFRETFLNIDEQIINNMNDLFMMIW